MGRQTNKQRRQAQAQSVREKAAAARALQQRAEQRRRAQIILSSILVLALIGGGIAAYAIGHKGKSGPATAVSPALLSQITGVPAAVSSSIGAGPSLPDRAPYTVTGGTSLARGGKPTLLYIGAEFCPYCAAERWALIQALSRFGTFSGIQQIKSSEDSISTFTFVNATYSSKYLNFDMRENEDQKGKPLQSVDSTQKAQWVKYPIPGQSGTGFPFLDFNGQLVAPVPMIDPTIVQGQSWTQIATALSDKSSTTAQAVDGAANTLTAAICQMTGNKPANVCTPKITGLSSQFKPYPAT
jgi:thiol-disulfide isomerase/thioredoxin